MALQRVTNEMELSANEEKDCNCRDQTAKQLSATLLGVALTVIACLVAASLSSFNITTVSVNKSRPNANFLAPIKSEEISLLSYSRFREAHHQGNDELISAATGNGRGDLASLSFEQLIFAANLIVVGRHNLATMSGLSTYYYHLSPESLLQLTSSWLSLLPQSPASRASGANESAGAAYERPVSGPKYYSDELRKINLFSWANKKVKKAQKYEIPNFPADEQPDPDRITRIEADLRPCLGGIRNQLNCGACYAFSWLSMVEWHYCMQNHGKLIDLSEQHLVDCGQLGGCKAGKSCLAKDFTIRSGVYLESDYPYVGKQGSCKQQSKEPFTRLSVDQYLPIKIDRQVFESTLQEQPILLNAQLPADFILYSSGIHHGTNCGKELSPHGMLLVGYGSQNGRPYWLLRNTLGKQWGEQGYMRMSRDSTNMEACFERAYVVRISFENVDPDKYIDFYNSIQYEPPRDPTPPKQIGLSRIVGSFMGKQL